ncbi:MAG: carbamoyltransferase HypF [Betaproteobacteria bacterium]
MEAENLVPAQQRIRVRGAVQGVGFRPHVYRLAHELALDGWVRNDGEGVEILVAGAPLALSRFVERVQREAPPLARIDAVEINDEEGTPLVAGFHIDASRGGNVTTGVTPDAAVCVDCLAELFDPADRRWRYPFLNCTHCGPRFTITAHLPYDRPNTSMGAFAMCPACEAEYHDPRDRRFHAQPTACPVCGPRLALWDSRGTPLAAADVVAEALRLIAGGSIVALKGLGGFHLACDARNARAVARLRERKARDEKPFALMCANVVSVAAFAGVGEHARALLQARERPIVLCPKRAGADDMLPGIAPGLAELGLMLPYTPLHWLLFHEDAGRPTGVEWTEQPQPLALVMTSANPGGEPLVIDNAEAVARLGGIADAFVVHDRGIVVRCDDSVVRTTVDRQPTTDNFSFVRRARGYTPAPIRLPHSGPPVLATGSYLKNTACLTRGAEAYLSQHIGDLDNAASCAALQEAVAHLRSVLEIRPQAVAHDLHPDNFGSRLALQLAAEWDVPAIGVQHHHAHVAAVAAEHGVDAPILGIALDGVGHGDDGGAWGGELLRVHGARFERLGHLRPLPLAGGDRAAREPWRMAAAVLHLLGRGNEIEKRFAAQSAAAAVAQMLAQDLRCPPTSSAGRWFDAAAGLLGIRSVMAYEGQAAMLLEGLAARHSPVAPDNSLFKIDHGQLDLLPLAARLADETDATFGAALFHATLASALAEWLAAAARTADLTTVALGGGCFLNRLLSVQLSRLLAARGYTVLQARQAPPNDGGISLGQAWIAICRLQQGD